MMPVTEPLASDPRTSRFAATAAEAEILLRRANHCCVFFRVGPADWQNNLLSVPKAVVSRKLKNSDAATPFPCELLEHDDGEHTLMIGVNSAIEAAGARR